MSAVYIHIPFCKRRCLYCDFITTANKGTMLPDYARSLQLEILNSPFPIEKARSVYFGGGTPSLLTPEQIAVLLKAVQTRYGLANDAEITLEVNPGTVSEEYYRQISELGINRLSIGAQSFLDKELKLLGRIHNAQEAIASFNSARKAGFDNISMDLIFGLPGQSLNDWQKSLDQIAALKPEHLSIYSLILEDNTPLTRAIEAGRLLKPDDDLVADMYEMTMDTLAVIGYEHYEISSWAVNPLFESRHNKVYWTGDDYLGFGVGAVGCVAGRRMRNTESIDDYILKLEQYARRYGDLKGGNLSVEAERSGEMSSVVVESEVLNREEQMKEFMILGLRMTREGVFEKSFFERFGVEMTVKFDKEIERLLSFDLMRWQGEPGNRQLLLTRKGIMLGNQVFRAFV